VREQGEWEKGRIPGAIHLTRGFIEFKIESVISDVDAPIIVYCGGGGRSAFVARNLQDMGYTRVESMEGGIGLWQERGYPVE